MQLCTFCVNWFNFCLSLIGIVWVLTRRNVTAVQSNFRKFCRGGKIVREARNIAIDGLRIRIHRLEVILISWVRGIRV